MQSKYIRLLAVTLVLFTAWVSPAYVVILQPVDDSTISNLSGQSDTPFGNANPLAMTGWLDIGVSRPQLKFSLSAIPDGWTVLSAVLTLEQVLLNKQVGYSSKEGSAVPTLRIEYIPCLSITRTNKLILVSWTGPSAGWVLECTDTLPSVAIASWPVVGPADSNQPRPLSVTITNTPAEGNQFFRLPKP